MSTYHYIPVRTEADPEAVNFVRVAKENLTEVELDLIKQISEMADKLTVIQRRKSPEMKSLELKLADAYSARDLYAVEGKQLHEV